MGNARVRQRKIGVQVDGLLEHLQRIVRVLAPRIAASPQIEVVSLGIFGGLLPDGFFFLRRQRDAQRLRDAAGNFVLDGEDVFQLPVVALCPYGMPCGTLHQLRRDAQAVPRPANGALENERGAQLLPDLRRNGLLVTERQHLRTRENLKLRDFGKLGDDVFGHAIAEVFVFFPAALIFEIKHGHRLFRWRGSGRKSGTGVGFSSGGPAAGINVPPQPLQIGAKFRRGLVTQVGVFFERFAENIFKGKGQPGIQFRRRCRIGMQYPIENQCHG